MSFERKSASPLRRAKPTRQASHPRNLPKQCQQGSDYCRQKRDFRQVGKASTTGLKWISGSGVGFQGLGAFIAGLGQPRNGVEPLLFDGSESTGISTRHHRNVRSPVERAVKCQ